MSGDSAQEKTERATPKREKDAREKGQVARSRELTTAVLVAGGVAMLAGQGSGMVSEAADLLAASLRITPADLATTADLPAHLGRLMKSGFLLVMPMLVLGFIGALVGPLLLGGWNFSPQAIAPQFSRMNPVAGLGRIFGSRAWMELGLGLAKVTVLGSVGAGALWSRREAFLNLATTDHLAGMATVGSALLGVMGWVAGGLVLLAALDVPFQLFRHRKELRMSKQEIKEEYKQSEGKPEVKGRIRQLQHAMASGRMMSEVPKADVIVTNPTHYAVALKYSAGTMRAPKVVAKGADVVAASIREIAREHQIPIVSAPPLARALYRSVELDQEIPAQLFQAVAQVLTYVYQLRNWRSGAPRPAEPQVGDVPGGEPDPVVPKTPG